MEELKDILTEEPQKTEVVEEKVEQEVDKPQSRRKAHQEKEQRARDDGGRFAKEEQKEEAAPEEPKVEVKAEEPKAEVKVEPKQEMSEKERAFLAAVQEERRKRQDLERRLAEVEKVKPAEEKTFWDDPEGHLKSFEQKLENERIQTKLQTAEAIARSKYPDFEENVTYFVEALQSTPGLHAQWLQSHDPGEFAYRLGKITKDVRSAGSIDALVEKIRKEEREKVHAEYKKKQDEIEKQRQDLTPSLSDVRGAARRTQPVFSGPTPLDSILSGK